MGMACAEVLSRFAERMPKGTAAESARKRLRDSNAAYGVLDISKLYVSRIWKCKSNRIMEWRPQPSQRINRPSRQIVFLTTNTAWFLGIAGRSPDRVIALLSTSSVQAIGASESMRVYGNGIGVCPHPVRRSQKFCL